MAFSTRHHLGQSRASSAPSSIVAATYCHRVRRGVRSSAPAGSGTGAGRKAVVVPSRRGFLRNVAVAAELQQQAAVSWFQKLFPSVSSKDSIADDEDEGEAIRTVNEVGFGALLVVCCSWAFLLVLYWQPSLTAPPT